MSTKFQIKQGDTEEALQLGIRKRQAAVNNITPPDVMWHTSKSIENVFFSMKKIAQLQEDGSYLYPDGTIHNTDGSILNPYNNTDALIANITLKPGEIMYADYSILQVDGNTRYPSGLIKTPANTYYLPDDTTLLPSGILLLSATAAYPNGYLFNINDTDRTNYYKVGNPYGYDSHQVNPDGTISIPNGSWVDASGNLNFPNYVMTLPATVEFVGGTTVRFPVGTLREDNLNINRNNAILLPAKTATHPALYTISYNATTKEYIFPLNTSITIDDIAQTAYITFPNAYEMSVPYETFQYGDNSFIFPYGTTYTSGTRTFTYPKEILTLPLDASITIIDPIVSVTFPDGSVMDAFASTVTLPYGNKLLLNGNAALYDGSYVILNLNTLQLYNGYIFYPRGTQKNSSGTVIHPDGNIPEGVYIRYYPTKLYPNGALVRTDGSIVNYDGSFTKLDNSVVNAAGMTIKSAHIEFDYFASPDVAPFIPVITESSFIVINKRTGSYEDITYVVTGSETDTMTLLKYQWYTEDTANSGLYSGEFGVKFLDGTYRTFPILKDDVLYIEVIKHFAVDKEVV